MVRRLIFALVAAAISTTASAQPDFSTARGEAVVPPAISNAVFDATGVRLRSVPYTPAKVKAAMGSSA